MHDKVIREEHIKLAV